MKKFSEMNIAASSDMKTFDCKQISITEIVNKEIVIRDYIEKINTRHGEDRLLMLVEVGGEPYKVFTNSGSIKRVMLLVPECNFPFSATIAALKTNNGTTYRLT